MKQDLREGRDALQIEEATYEEHLDMVARAARMSTMHIDRNPDEVWFQLHGRLQRHAKSCEERQQFVRELELCAPKPWAKSLTGFLDQAGGAGLDVIRSRAHVLDL